MQRKRAAADPNGCHFIELILGMAEMSDEQLKVALGPLVRDQTAATLFEQYHQWTKPRSLPRANKQRRQ